MKGIVFDCEIYAAIPTPGEIPVKELHYCKGWDDFSGMGISCITAIDTVDMSPHVFLQDNLYDFRILLANREWSIGFNSLAFDLPLLDSVGIRLDRSRHFDLARAIWASAGVPSGEHPKGLGLDALCRANGIGAKRGNGEDAPMLAQRGAIGQLADYCMGDTFLTWRLLNRILSQGGVKDPRKSQQWNHDHGWIPVGITL